jgi:hypothetical protein
MVTANIFFFWLTIALRICRHITDESIVILYQNSGKSNTGHTDHWYTDVGDSFRPIRTRLTDLRSQKFKFYKKLIFQSQDKFLELLEYIDFVKTNLTLKSSSDIKAGGVCCPSEFHQTFQVQVEQGIH